MELPYSLSQHITYLEEEKERLLRELDAIDQKLARAYLERNRLHNESLPISKLPAEILVQIQAGQLSIFFQPESKAIAP